MIGEQFHHPDSLRDSSQGDIALGLCSRRRDNDSAAVSLGGPLPAHWETRSGAVIANSEPQH
jgi:hypothetical protein